MKKLFLLIICSAFSIIINAQILYVENLSSFDIDVQGISKFQNTSCVSSQVCGMNDMLNIPALFGMDNQSYPNANNCATTPNIKLTIFEGSDFVNIEYCGAPQSGTFGTNNISYALDVTGVSSNVLLILN